MMKLNFLFALLFFGFEVRANSDVNRQLLEAAEHACSQFPRIQSVGSVRTRLLGGNIAEEGEFPWMAALGYIDDRKLSFGCGGIVISEYYVMTAAHCTRDSYPPVVVRLGKVTLNDTDTDEIKASHYYVKNITRHPNYSMLTKKNDIALLGLTEKISFTNTIRPACLHTDIGDIDNRTKLIVTGWGITDTATSSSPSNELRKIEINTIPLGECNNTYLNYNIEFMWNLSTFRNGLSDGQYCAYDPVDKKDACQGDSGGPLQLIHNNDPNNATIVGIVSGGMGCGLQLPGIYTRVAHYITWIESIVWP